MGLRIGYFYRTKVTESYFEFTPNEDPWYGGSKKNVIAEDAIVAYMKYAYPQNTYIKLNAHRFNKKLALSCDIVWFAFEEQANLFKYQVAWATRPKSIAARKRKYTQRWEDIMTLPNLFPPRKVNDFIFDKCKYYAAAKRWGIPIEKTQCTASMDITAKGMRTKLNRFAEKVYVKPLPSSEAFGNIVFNKPYDVGALEDYLREMRSTGIDKLCIQRFNPHFATKSFPEYRTIWVGKRFSHGIKTVGAGYTTGEMKRIPAKLRRACLNLIDKLEKRFRVPMISLRLDWGKTDGGEFFLNEIEQSYGSFVDDISFRTQLEKKIGDQFMTEALKYAKL